MDASHRSRLHNLTATHIVRKAPYGGVQQTRNGRRWTAQITDSRIRNRTCTVHIGTFDSAKTAAAAYDFALIALGNAPFNFPIEHYRDSYPEGALRQSMAAVRARLGLRAPA